MRLEQGGDFGIAVRPIADQIGDALRGERLRDPPERSAMRSLTLQVMHHAAVRLTKTGLFWARNSASRAAVKLSALGPAPCSVVVEGWLAVAGGRLAAPSTMAPTARAAAAVAVAMVPVSIARPTSHAAKPVPSNVREAANTPSLPCCTLSTQTSQATVA